MLFPDHRCKRLIFYVFDEPLVVFWPSRAYKHIDCDFEYRVLEKPLLVITRHTSFRVSLSLRLETPQVGESSVPQGSGLPWPGSEPITDPYLQYSLNLTKWVTLSASWSGHYYSKQNLKHHTSNQQTQVLPNYMLIPCAKYRSTRCTSYGWRASVLIWPLQLAPEREPMCRRYMLRLRGTAVGV